MIVESLVVLVIIVFLVIQTISLASIVCTILGAKWAGLVFALIAMTGGLYTGRFRFEGLLYWFFPACALVLWVWKFQGTILAIWLR